MRLEYSESMPSMVVPGATKDPHVARGLQTNVLSWLTHNIYMYIYVCVYICVCVSLNAVKLRALRNLLELVDFVLYISLYRQR